MARASGDVSDCGCDIACETLTVETIEWDANRGEVEKREVAGGYLEVERRRG